MNRRFASLFFILASSLVAACDSGAETAGTTGTAGTAGAGANGGSGGSGATGTGASAGTSSGGTSTGGSTSSSGGSTGTGGLDPSGLGPNGAWCKPIPACDAAPPTVSELPWKHDILSPTIAAGTPGHRGRDLFLNPGNAQWIIGKFAYSFVPVEIDKDLKDEQVDIYLLRNCEGDWEHLGSGFTTEDNAHPTVEGVDDSGGRIYFQIPGDKTLGLGRHRVHMVVRGDLTTADMFIEVVPNGTPVFVSDVDGTLTTFETEEFVDLLTGTIPDMNPDANKAFQILASKGYHPFYLTARPEDLVHRTREFLAQKGFPPGIVHTTLSLTGALGGSAETYKTDELNAIVARGLFPTYGFGNTESDGAAYDNINIQPKSARVFFQFDDPLGGRRIESYTELLTEFENLPNLCSQ
ncbi:MAG: phosphatidylinositol transfer protein [Polyangiaceae bacterium]|nr:phosphatidylinositol transfer protein [Polyangiaceae bacterium]